MNKTDSLLFKFAMIFAVFIIVALGLSGVSAYINQRDIYRNQLEERLVHIAKHLAYLVEKEGRVFVDFQNFLIKHKDEILVPMDYDGNWWPEWLNFDALFRSRYPGKTLGVNIDFTEMDEELQMAYASYMHRRWLAIFEKTAKDFDIRYAYYLVPSDKNLHMFWVIDALREAKTVDGRPYITLCTEVEEPLEKHRCMWDAWNSGGPAKGYDTYDNEFGKTYAYYVGVYIDGKKSGVVGTEVEIAAVDKAILENTMIQIAWISAVLALCVAVTLYIIYRRYILKLSRLQHSVRRYAEEKDPSIVRNIEDNGQGRDEISSLSMQTAAMILELENYIHSIREITQELGKEKERADAMNDLANKDALTGIRNKLAYDKEVNRLEWAIEDESADFGIAVIDLNFLKRINDTFGHEMGNQAIKRLCHIVCTTFKHSPVFRIGGDEFAVILENEDLKHVQALVDGFNEQLAKDAKDESLDTWERTSAAIGVAIFEPARDHSVANVFKRADKAMYARKKAMKGCRKE